MSLDLDKRQRAMLSEMGIKLWQPPSVKKAELVHAAPEAEAEAEMKPRVQTAQAAAPARPMPAPTPPPSAAQAASDRSTDAAWQLGQPQALYPLPSEPATAIRWLVLSELGAGASAPLEGEAGQLLDNMLRAAGMHRDAALQFVPVTRGRGAEAAGDRALQEQLAGLIASEQPTAMLVMGRLAAQALLPSPEPFGKRQGQHLSAHGCPVLLTYDATYLLRQLPEKARAWEDLCQARVMAVRAVAS